MLESAVAVAHLICATAKMGVVLIASSVVVFGDCRQLRFDANVDVGGVIGRLHSNAGQCRPICWTGLR